MNRFKEMQNGGNYTTSKDKSIDALPPQTAFIRIPNENVDENEVLSCPQHR